MDMKILLVEHLIAHYPEAIIAAEVPFYFGERRADIVMINNDGITAFEIKSEKDTPARLPYQIKSYKEFFDYCYIVLEPSNLQEIRKLIPRSIGIICISKNQTKKIRQSYPFKRQNKLTLASIFPTMGLKHLLKNTPPFQSSQFELAKQVSETLTLKELKPLVKEFLTQKYKNNFSLMKSEIFKKITADDIQTISRQVPMQILKE